MRQVFFILLIDPIYRSSKRCNEQRPIYVDKKREKSAFLASKSAFSFSTFSFLLSFFQEADCWRSLMLPLINIYLFVVLTEERYLCGLRKREEEEEKKKKRIEVFLSSSGCDYVYIHLVIPFVFV